MRLSLALQGARFDKLKRLLESLIVAVKLDLDACLKHTMSNCLDRSLIEPEEYETQNNRLPDAPWFSVHGPRCCRKTGCDDRCSTKTSLGIECLGTVLRDVGD